MDKSAHSDPDLLNEWLGQHREAAFHTLVARYADLVYATAKRKCNDHSLAAEASQLTFITLAQKAKTLTSCTSLGGWLHLTAVMQSRNLVRKSQCESRKRLLLQAAMETELYHHHNESWQELQPVLDDALATLSAKDREALMLRFYRSLTVREIATTLGIATDAAQKRIDRATDRLRSKLARRGFQTSSSLSAALLAGYAAEAQAAPLPISLLASKAISAAAISSTGLSHLFVTLAILMKPSSIVLPALIFIVTSGFIASQRRSLSTAHGITAKMQQTLVRVETAPHAASASRDLPRKNAEEPQVPVSSINGKVLIRQMAEMLSSRLAPNDDSTWKFFKENAALLTAEDLVAALDDLSLHDFHAETHMELAHELLLYLARKNPAMCMAYYSDDPHSQHRRRIGCYEVAIYQWVTKDPTQASAWLDQQSAAGKLEGKRLDGQDSPRMLFNRSLVTALLVHDPSSAKLRLQKISAVPQGEFKSLFSWFNFPEFSRNEPPTPEVFAGVYKKRTARESATIRDCYEIIMGTLPK